MVEDNAPKISVILPMKNGAAYIETAIRSVLFQTFADFELLIIDDGSSDGALGLAERLSQLDSRVRVLRNPGSGLVDALNFGIRFARAPLIARMDGDDVALPGRFQRQYDFLLSHPEIDVVGTQVIFIDERGAATGKRTALPEDSAAVSKILLKFCCIRHPTVLMRKSAVECVGGYRAQLTAAEDLDLWLRLAERGKLANLPEALLFYRLHAGQVTNEKMWTQRLSRNLAIISAQERRAGRADPIAAYACFSGEPGKHVCRGLGCSKAVCESLRAFGAAEALLSIAPDQLAQDDARLLVRYLSRQSIGDGKSNALRVLIELCRHAARRRALLLLAKAFGLALRIHPGRALRMSLALRKSTA